MKSTVTSKGQTVVPKELRDRLHLTPGTVLQWTDEGDTMRVEKLETRNRRSFLQALKSLGAVPAAARDRRPVAAPKVDE